MSECAHNWNWTPQPNDPPCPYCENETLKAEVERLQLKFNTETEILDDVMNERDRLLQHHKNIISAASTFTKDHPSAYLRGGMDAMVAESEKAINHMEG